MGQPFDPDDVLALLLMANLATVAEDGAPRNAPVWFIWEDGALWMLGSSDASSVLRLERDVSFFRSGPDMAWPPG